MPIFGRVARRILAHLLPLVLVVSVVGVRHADGGTPSPVGYVGCSNSSLAVIGYAEDGGRLFWTPSVSPTLTYDNGTLLRWAAFPWYWSEFGALDAAKPGARRVWLQACILAAESVAASEQALEKVVQGIEQRLPGAVIYGSAINGYTGIVCPKIGANGVTKSQQVIRWGVQQRLLSPGPTLPALSPAQLGDGCHPNVAGRQLLGRALLRFFG
jgi:hypothetical protein